MREQEPLKHYRHEYKYICDAAQNAVLKLRAQGILHTDKHAGQAGCYWIRSLYFDSPGDHCYYENENGVDCRAKYRIRMYNCDPSYLVLEKKSKCRGMTRKKACPVDAALCRRMAAGQFGIEPDRDAALKELLWEMQQLCMRPAVIVEYLRYPFVEKNGNVRVTFDEHICSSNELSGFFSGKIVRRPVMKSGESVLEVKWDAFLPGTIREFLQMESLQWSSFSKYYLCRKYNTSGGIRA